MHKWADWQCPIHDVYFGWFSPCFHTVNHLQDVKLGLVLGSPSQRWFKCWLRLDWRSFYSVVLFYELRHWYCAVKVEFSAPVNRLAKQHTIQCSPWPEFRFDSSPCFLNPRDIIRIQFGFCKNQQKRWLECKRVTTTLRWRPCYRPPSLVRLRWTKWWNLRFFGRWFEVKLFANCSEIWLDKWLLPRYPKRTESNFLMPILFNLWKSTSCCATRH